MIVRLRTYHYVYLKAYGEQPWDCLRCTKEANVIHHVDEDRSNNVIENLQALCLDCHRFIHRGVKRPISTGQKIAASKLGKPRDEETKRKISESLKGRPATKSAEARRGKPTGPSKARSDAMKKWWAERKNNAEDK